MRGRMVEVVGRKVERWMRDGFELVVGLVVWAGRWVEILFWVLQADVLYSESNETSSMVTARDRYFFDIRSVNGFNRAPGAHVADMASGEAQGRHITPGHGCLPRCVPRNFTAS